MCVFCVRKGGSEGLLNSLSFGLSFYENTSMRCMNILSKFTGCAMFQAIQNLKLGFFVFEPELEIIEYVIYASRLGATLPFFVGGRHSRLKCLDQ